MLRVERVSGEVAHHARVEQLSAAAALAPAAAALACLEQRNSDVSRPNHRCMVQRQQSLPVGHVRLCAVREQPARIGGSPEPRSVVQRCKTVGALPVEQRTARVKQLQHPDDVTRGRRSMRRTHGDGRQVVVNFEVQFPSSLTPAQKEKVREALTPN